MGHSCAQAFTGPEALELARSQSFDLVLLDVMLPGLDGFAVKAKLPADLPVIFVTAKTSLSDKLQGLGLGAEDYIVKPFEVLELLAQFDRAWIFSAHTHNNKTNYTHAVGSKKIREYILGTSCGAWWHGTVCTDGAPNGYGVFEYDARRSRT